MTEKPNDFMEGFGYGITSMASGIFYGVTDIVRKPIEGIKQEKNLSGFGKGILKGIGGVITKPIAGVIDLVSKTSEGFKNTINKDVYSQRVRLPMPLYGKYKFYKEHNKREAEFYYFIKKFFKESFKRLFEANEDGNLKMCFKGMTEIFVTKPLKIKGALGHLVSLNKNNLDMVSNDYPVGEGKTILWNLGGIDNTSTYTFILDQSNTDENVAKSLRYCTIQILTTYIASDRSTRLRVTTFRRKFSPDLQNNKYEVAQGFDQEAAVILLTKMAIWKSDTEERIDVLRWVDKSLINLMQRFGEYNKDVPSSFRLTKEFSYFPQFVFYLRRSLILQNFNASPDEVAQFKTILLRENVYNSTIMIQPTLISYSPDKNEYEPVLLEAENMKSDRVLLLDSYFIICIWIRYSYTTRSIIIKWCKTTCGTTLC